MGSKKLAKKINMFSWLSVLCIICLIAFFSLDPLLYFSDKGDWYSSAALKFYLRTPFAERFADKAYAFDNSSVEARLIYFTIHGRKGDVPGAEDGLLTIYKSNVPFYSREALAHLSFISLKNCELDHAREYVQEGMEQFTEDRRFYLYASVLSVKEGNLSEASYFLDQASNISAEKAPFEPYESINSRLRAVSTLLPNKSQDSLKDARTRQSDHIWAKAYTKKCY
jgi:hypothetical protein